MKQLFEIVKERNAKQIQLNNKRQEFEAFQKKITDEISELRRLENIGEAGIDLSKVQLAETVLYVRGDPYGITDDKGPNIAELAIIDIANGCEHLKTEFWGNKTYSGYYQRCDCSYGFGPSHGGICDCIGLNDKARKRELTGEEKDACIYYIKNYKKIKSLKAVA